MSASDVLRVVSITGFSLIASLIHPNYIVLPALSALFFPFLPVEAAFTALVTCLTVGSIVRFIKK